MGDSEEQVRLLSRAMVRPAQPTPNHPFFLSCLDIFWQDIHYNQRLIFYDNTGVSANGGQAALLQKLKSSLALCLVHYYPWCGRIAKAALPPHRLFIDCNDAPGVEFVEASSDLPLSSLSQDRFQMNPFFLHLSQFPDHKGDSLYRSPLLSIQATLFVDGGLALGIAQSHMVADGQSLWNFMVSWGECSRGVPLSLPPLHNRERLAVPDPSPEKASTWTISPQMKEEDKEEEEMESVVVEQNDKDNGSSSVETPASLGDKGRPSLNSNGNNESTGGTKASPNPDPLVQCVFDLPSLAVKKLKGEAGEGFTSYEVICAHFWQRVTIARQSPRYDPTLFAVLANCRTRVTPPLSPGYFGNVITFCLARSTAGKIGRESLSATASRIHESIAQTQEDNLVSFMHWLETHDNRIVNIGSSAPKGKRLNVASSPRFPAYEVDFGWGTSPFGRSRQAEKGNWSCLGGAPDPFKGMWRFALPSLVAF